MIPNHNEIRYMLLHQFLKKKTLDKKMALTLLTKIFNMSEKELAIRTKKGYDYSFSNKIKWEFKNLVEMGFVKKSGSQYTITKTGVNICRLLEVQRTQN